MLGWMDGWDWIWMSTPMLVWLVPSAPSSTSPFGSRRLQTASPAARAGPMRLVVPNDPPASEIVELAARRRSDLIVAGTREPGLLSRLLGRSVSGSVQRKAHCDVLIVH
jgi:nucleotide-binding universal stress UspA family protein